MTMGLACLLFPLFVRSPWQAVCLGVLFAGVLGLLRWKSDLLGGGGALLPASRFGSEGEFYFVAGVTLALLFARENRFVYSSSILVLTFADTAAAVAGKRIGRRHCWGNAKTLEGSLAFFFVALLCLQATSLATGQECSLRLICAIGILATAAEGISGRGSDNLFIPLACVPGMQLPDFYSWISHWLCRVA
jgi:phytol kinase